MYHKTKKRLLYPYRGSTGKRSLKSTRRRNNPSLHETTGKVDKGEARILALVAPQVEKNATKAIAKNNGKIICYESHHLTLQYSVSGHTGRYGMEQRMETGVLAVGVVGHRMLDAFESALDRGVSVSILIHPELVETVPDDLRAKYATRLGAHDRYASRTSAAIDGTLELGPFTVDADHAAAVLDYLDTYNYATVYHAMFHTMWHTGCRISGIESLDIDDFEQFRTSLI